MYKTLENRYEIWLRPRSQYRRRNVVLVKTYRQSKDAIGIFQLVDKCRCGIIPLAAMLVNKCLPSEKMPTNRDKK